MPELAKLLLDDEPVPVRVLREGGRSELLDLPRRERGRQHRAEVPVLRAVSAEQRRGLERGGEGEAKRWVPTATGPAAAAAGRR